ncbi:MAG: RNA chaperone Hfq [Candidatus Aminicenantes bacterium]|nr:RNA chaperone Hfq [Candidatus Aminicenantes bacterium]
MNRRLIRPNLSEIKEKMKSAEVPSPKPQPSHPVPPAHETRGGHGPGQHPQGGPHLQKKMHPPTDTSAESYYYLKQMSKKTPMAVVFSDGEMIEGYIEWYDRSCIKLNREGAPNLLVYKNSIKYLYKLDEGKEGGEGEPDDRR